MIVIFNCNYCSSSSKERKNATFRRNPAFSVAELNNFIDKNSEKIQ